MISDLLCLKPRRLKNLLILNLITHFEFHHLSLCEHNNQNIVVFVVAVDVYKYIQYELVIVAAIIAS